MSAGADDGEALLARGRQALDDGNLDAAVEAFGAATRAGLDDPSRAWNNLGVALRAQGHGHAAVACYRRALAFDPDGAESWGNLGNALMADGRLDAALAAIEAALARAPDRPAYRFQRGCALLHLGRYADGWPGFERRYEAGRLTPRDLGAPLWHGGPLDGATLLVHAEQGFGDMLQFARFLPAAIERAGGRVVLEVHPALKRLFAASFPSLPVVAVGEDLPAHDVRCGLPSLPYLLGAPDIAMAGPYLRAPDGSPPVELSDAGGRLRVGLTWAGKLMPWDRSCPFEAMIGLLELPDVAFYSLQRGEAAGDIARCGAVALVVDLGSRLGDFADDALVLRGLDLVISIDTAIVHLAGALGRPVWTLMTYMSDWRFPAGRDDCDWYPSLRLLRQPRPGDWPAVIAMAREALAERAAGRR